MRREDWRGDWRGRLGGELNVAGSVLRDPTLKWARIGEARAGARVDGAGPDVEAAISDVLLNVKTSDDGDSGDPIIRRPRAAREGELTVGESMSGDASEDGECRERWCEWASELPEYSGAAYRLDADSVGELCGIDGVNVAAATADPGPNGRNPPFRGERAAHPLTRGEAKARAVTEARVSGDLLGKAGTDATEL